MEHGARGATVCRGVMGAGAVPQSRGSMYGVTPDAPFLIVVSIS